MEKCKESVSIHEAAEKFRKYAANVEQDIEGLIFELLDLLDTKTKTLRKLLKLYLHINKISGMKFTYDMQNTNFALLVCNNSTSALSSTTKIISCSHLSINDDISEVDKCPSLASEHIESKLAEVGERLAEIKILEDHIDDGSEYDKQNDNSSVIKMAKRLVRDLIDNSAIDQNSIDPKRKQNNIPDDKGPKYSNETDSSVPITMMTRNMNTQSKTSLLTNLEVVLSNLENGKLTESGILLDHSTYKIVLSALKTTITKYDQEVTNCGEAVRQNYKYNRRDLLLRSRTPPVFRSNLETASNQLFSSSTDCVKQKKKRC